MTGPVLVLDAGSASFHLAVVDDHDEVLDQRDLDGPPDSRAAAAIEGFLARAPSVTACGHRLVHGGPDIRRPTLLDFAVRRSVEAAASLAPLHVPPALTALDAARQLLPDLPHIVCPDTAFHDGLPEPARTYALPKEWTRRHGLRRYGFHGLSYAYTLRRTAELLGRPATELQAPHPPGRGLLHLRRPRRRERRHHHGNAPAGRTPDEQPERQRRPRHAPLASDRGGHGAAPAG